MTYAPTAARFIHDTSAAVIWRNAMNAADVRTALRVCPRVILPPNLTPENVADELRTQRERRLRRALGRFVAAYAERDRAWRLHIAIWRGIEHASRPHLDRSNGYERHRADSNFAYAMEDAWSAIVLEALAPQA